MNGHVARTGEKKWMWVFAVEAEGNMLFGRSKTMCGKPILN